MKLKDIREENRKTQREISTFLEITQQQYSLYEKENRDMPVRLLIKLADYYGVSIDYLVGRNA